MKNLKLSLALLFSLILIGCGGGGGSGPGSATFVGRVLNVETGGPTNPASTVQTTNGENSTATDLADGSFQLPVSGGTNQLSVIPNITGFPVFTFNTPPASGTTDVGDLWVGPETVTLSGRVLRSTDNQPVANATVSFAGRTGTTDAQGNFDLQNVAYSSDTQTAFWGIVGSVSATGFFRVDFNAAPNVAFNGTVDVGDILITPSNDPTPPPPPYNITGRVFPIGQSAGTIVRLKQGGTDVRVYNVGNDGRYYFWVAPGNYTVTFEKGAQTAPTQNANLTEPNQTVQVPDVTLN